MPRSLIPAVLWGSAALGASPSPMPKITPLPPKSAIKPVAKPAVKNDGLCRQGERKIKLDLSSHFPSNEDQGEMGICYTHALLGGFGTGCERLDHKPRHFSATAALSSYLMSFSQFEINDRVAGVRAAHDEQTFAPVPGGASPSPASPSVRRPGQKLEHFLDGGFYTDMSEAVIKDGFLPAADTKDATEYRNLNKAIHLAVLTQGKSLTPQSLQAIVKPYRDQVLARLKKDSVNDCDVSKFRSITFMPDAGSGASIHGENLYFMELLEQQAPVVKDFLAYYARAPGSKPRFAFNMTEEAKDAFFGTQKYNDVMNAYAKTSALTATQIDAMVQNAWSIRQRFAKAYPELAKDPTRSFSPELARKVIESKCESSSPKAREVILENLCHGIPVLAALNIQGLEKPLFPIQPSKAKSGGPPVPAMPPEMSQRLDRYYDAALTEDSGHAMVIQGVEKINGHNYFVFRNSWKDTPVFLMPFSQSCRLRQLTVILNPKDPGYVPTRNDAIINQEEHIDLRGPMPMPSKVH